MKKILRRLAMFFLVLGIALIITGAFVRNRVRQVPSWYRHLHLNDAMQQQAANSMTQKLAATYSQANDAVAAATRAKFPLPEQATQPVDLPPASFTLELSEAEINSFFAEWDTTEHWRQKLAKYVVDPVVILEDHELILAGMVPEWNVVLSLHFVPKIEKGKLDMGLKRVMAGTLTLPKSTADSYIGKIDALISPKLPEHRRNAEINPKGWANNDAVSAAMGELVLHVLHDEPAEPVFMLQELGHNRDARSVPVRITGVDISEKTLKLDLRTMTPDERDALLQHLRGTDVLASN
ncbi:MAG TPA: hypothetical protein VFE47_17985 [Tepidisphaeraceae bacterium]|jgi:hypothetical protein|nr:hypothetical protein [Tepidisphaeraceae bacterium]